MTTHRPPESATPPADEGASDRAEVRGGPQAQAGGDLDALGGQEALVGLHAGPRELYSLGSPDSTQAAHSRTGRPAFRRSPFAFHRASAFGSPSTHR